MSAAPIFKDFRPEDKRDESLSNSGWKRGELEISKAPISFKITQSNQGNTHALKLSFKGALLATYLFDKSLLSGLTKSTEYSERYLGILNDQLIGFIEKNLHIEDIDSARSAFQINNTAPESDRAETVTITPGSQAGSLPSLDDSRVKTPTPPPPVGDGAPKGKPTPSPQRAEPLAAASAAAPVATHSTMPPLPKLTVAFPEPKPEPEAFIPTDATIAEALQELVAAKQRKALLGQTLVGHTDWSPQKMADYLGIDLMLMPQFTAAFSHCETAEAALNSLNHFRAKSYLTDTSRKKFRKSCFANQSTSTDRKKPIRDSGRLV